MHFEISEDEDDFYFDCPAENTAKLMEFLRGHVQSMTIDVNGHGGGALPDQEGEKLVEIDVFNIPKREANTTTALDRATLQGLLNQFFMTLPIGGEE